MPARPNHAAAADIGALGRFGGGHLHHVLRVGFDESAMRLAAGGRPELSATSAEAAVEIDVHDSFYRQGLEN